MKQNSDRKRQAIIGITGGIGSGKTTVTEYLLKKGFTVVDADRISRNIMDEYGTVLEVVDSFGNGILDENGNVDRRKLRRMIFSDEDLLKRLNGILHPKIRECIEKDIERFKKEGNRIIFLDAPLLIENNLDKMVDEVWLVSCSIETQLERVVKRDGTNRKEVGKIIERQMPFEEKIKHSDIVFRNEGSIEELKDKIDDALKNLIDRI